MQVPKLKPISLIAFPYQVAVGRQINRKLTIGYDVYEFKIAFQ